MNVADESTTDLPTPRLVVVVDGRRIVADLARPQASGDGPRQPRWMLRIEGGEPTRGPLTWDGFLDMDIEGAAIIAFVQERQQVASLYRREQGALLRQLYDSGRLPSLADALAVPVSDLLPEAG